MKGLEARAKQTGVKSAPLLNKPKLRPEDDEYLTAFFAIGDSRRMGMNSPDPIQITEILAFCQLMGIESFDVRSKYLRLTQRMDAAYLNYWHRAHPQKT